MQTLNRTSSIPYMQSEVFRLSKAFKAVLPKPFPVLPVGGITPEKIGPYIQAGASGFGLGSALYKSGSSAKEVHEKAEKFNHALKEVSFASSC